MDKRLILIRHAKSSWNNPLLTDKERPLNKRGKRVAPIMGEWLNEYCENHHIQSIKFLVSTATRTQQTLNLIKESLDGVASSIYLRDDIYLAGAETLDELITAQSDNTYCLALVGHNPGIHMLVEHYTGKQLNKFPTCAMACLNFNSEHWSDITHTNCVASEIQTPKRLQI